MPDMWKCMLIDSLCKPSTYREPRATVVAIFCNLFTIIVFSPHSLLLLRNPFWCVFVVAVTNTIFPIHGAPSRSHVMDVLTVLNLSTLINASRFSHIYSQSTNNWNFAIIFATSFPKSELSISSTYSSKP